jgi:hypothetical protein
MGAKLMKATIANLEYLIKRLKAKFPDKDITVRFDFNRKIEDFAVSIGEQFFSVQDHMIQEIIDYFVEDNQQLTLSKVSSFQQSSNFFLECHFTFKFTYPWKRNATRSVSLHKLCR